MATYGRYTRVCESLACFLLQDWSERHLWILNNHPVPLYFEHPLVTVLNEGERHQTLGHCRNRLLSFADGEFLRTHDDDDLWMPWAFSQGVERIGEAHAWKPTRSWFYDGQGNTGTTRRGSGRLVANAMEASVTWRTSFVRGVGYRNGEGDEHLPLLDGLGPKGLAQDEMGEWTGYCYRWGCGEWHASGSLGNGRSDDERAADWKRHNDDIRPGTPLVPAFDTVLEWYRRLVSFVEPSLQTAWMAAALGIAPPHRRPPPVPAKVIDSDRLKNLSGSCIIVPGSFDVCTEGQVRLLEWAKSQGDHLLVLVPDDPPVSGLEGNHRPLVPLAGRVSSLSALDVVDGILIDDGQSGLQGLECVGPILVIRRPSDEDKSFALAFPEQCEIRFAPMDAQHEIRFRPEFEGLLESTNHG